MNLDLDGAERVEDEDREDIQENIKEASKQGDLSPRHVNQLNKGKRSSKAANKKTMSSMVKPPLVKQ